MIKDEFEEKGPIICWLKRLIGYLEQDEVCIKYSDAHSMCSVAYIGPTTDGWKSYVVTGEKQHHIDLGLVNLAEEFDYHNKIDDLARKDV